MAEIDLIRAGAPGALPTAAEMAAFDKSTIVGGTSGLELMERAAEGMFQALARAAGGVDGKRCLALCGPGNNGGDALALARRLAQAGAIVTAVIAPSDKTSREFDQQLEKAGCELRGFGAGFRNAAAISSDALRDLASRADILIDGLLGTGQRSAPRGAMKDMLEACGAAQRGAGCLAVSLDLPTGIDADTGEAFEPGFAAGLTLTVEAIKRGMLQSPARDRCGRIEVIPIGIDLGGPCECRLAQPSGLRRLKSRKHDAHKTDFGHVLILGGSQDMPGAPVLAARAALRTGAGLVTKAHFISAPPVMQPPEIMLKCLPGEHFEPRHLEPLKESILRSKAIVIGPGMSRAPLAGSFLSDLSNYAALKSIPMVVDADALNLIAQGVPADLSRSVITPHPGEAARLLKIPSAEVQRDRYKSAKNLLATGAAVSLLKGAGTIVASLQGLKLVARGTPFMATAGSGDVLCGVIAALLSQGFGLAEAAELGAYLHAVAGELALDAKGGSPITAGDIVESIPEALRGCCL